MLFRREIQFAWGAPTADLYIVIFIRAFGHILGRQVGNTDQLVRQQSVQILECSESLRLLMHHISRRV
jgi:hypothetical protein